MGAKTKLLIGVGVLFRTYPVMDAAKDFKYLIVCYWLRSVMGEHTVGS